MSTYDTNHGSHDKMSFLHDDVIKWKHFLCYWPFVQGIHQSLMNSPHKGQWHGALMFSFICAWMNGWVNNRGTGDLRSHCAHYDVNVMVFLTGIHREPFQSKGHLSWYRDTLTKKRWDWNPLINMMGIPTVYPRKYAHRFCFAVLCCGYTLTDFPISIRLTSLALWQSNDCPSASKATLMNMDKYFMWIHYKRLHNHNKAKHNKTVCIFLGIYCILVR